jgi:hypothetical protein
VVHDVVEEQAADGTRQEMSARASTTLRHALQTHQGAWGQDAKGVDRQRRRAGGLTRHTAVVGAGPFLQPVRLAYQPPVSSTFLSQQTSHQQPVSSTFLS